MPASDQSERIAIVGVGGIFPGAPDLDTFWKNVAGGVDCGRQVTDGRWYLSPDKAYAPWPPQPDRVYSTWGCFIEGFQFDPEGLNLDRSLLERLDPMFHLGLHAARAAFRDARQLAGIDHSRVGVILGNIALPTESTSTICRDVLGRTFVEKLIDEVASGEGRGTRDKKSAAELKATLHRASPPSNLLSSSGTQPSTLNPQPSWHPLNRYAAGLPASLIAQGLGLGGTAFTLDAACASSLYALKFASEELLAHRADAMLAGGMSRPDCQYTQMGFAQLQALSKSGRCAPLSGEADGLVVGEGAGVFVLKRLSDAVAAGDHIYGVIAGIGLSNDRGANLLAPHSEGQLRAMRSAYEQAGWKPSDVDLIECHATGTPVGDAVEIESLHQLWQHETARPQQCVIGGVKSNVGHLLTGAGAAGLMKVLFALKHRTLPPTANYRQPAARMLAGDSPFRVLGEAQPWEARVEGRRLRVEGQQEDGTLIPRRATINAFGFGGINAHVLIEEWCDDSRDATCRMGTPARPLGSTTSLGSTTQQTSSESEERTGRSAHPTTPIEPAVAVVGIGVHAGNWDSKPSFQEHDFQGKPLDWTRLNWWGVEETDWFRRESLDEQVPNLPHVAVDHSIQEVRMPMGQFRIPPLEMQDMLPQQQLMLKVAAEALRDAGSHRDQTALLPPSPRRGGPGRGEDGRATSETQQQLPRDVFKVDDVHTQSSPLPNPPRRGEGGSPLATRHSPLATSPSLNPQPSTLDPSRTGVFIGTELDPNTTNFHLRWSIEQDAPRWAEMLRLDLTPDELIEWTKRLKDAAGPPLTPNRVMGNLGGIVASRLAREFDVGGPSFTISAGGDGGGVAFHVAVGMLQRGELDRAIVGAVDLPCDVRSLVGGLEREPQDGAIAFILERLEDAHHKGQRVHAVFDGAASRRPVAPPTGGLPTRQETHLPTGLAPVESGFCTTRQQSPTARMDHTSSAETELHRGKPGGVVCGGAPLRHFRPEAATASARQLWRDATEEPSPQARESAGWRKPLGETGRVAFVFPGSGNAFIGMGRELLEKFPDVLRRQEAENQRLRDQYRPDLIWEGRSSADLFANHKAMIFGQVAIGTAVCDLLALFVVRPSASIGYSLGESAALFGLRAWTDRDEMLRRMEESPLFGSDLVAPFDAARNAWGVPEGQPVDWVSGVIDRSADEVRAAIGNLLRHSHSMDGVAGVGASSRNPGASFAKPQSSPGHPTALIGGDDAVGWDQRRFAAPAHHDVVANPDGGPALEASWSHPTVHSQPRVYLLIVNTPTQCVIGGERSSVERLVRDLAATFVLFSALSTVHCEILREEEAKYRELHLMRTVKVDGRRLMVDGEGSGDEPSDHQPSTIDHQPAPIDFYSTAWGCKYDLTRESAAEAIVAQAVGTIDFPRVIEQAYADGVRVFVEIGPGSSCTKMIDEILGDRPHLARAALPNTSRPVETFLELLAALMAEGVPVDLSYLYGEGLRVEGRGLRARQDEAKTPVREIVTRVGGLPFEIPSPPGGWKFHEPAAETTSLDHLLNRHPTGLAPVESGLCTTRLESATQTLPSAVVQKPASHRDKPGGVVDCMGSSPRVDGQDEAVSHPTRGALPTRLNEDASSIHPSPIATPQSPLLTLNPRPSTLNLFNQLQLMTDHRTQAHDTFLRFSARAERLAAQHLAVLAQGGHVLGGIHGIDRTDPSDLSDLPSTPLVQRTTPPRSLNRDECLTFAIGKIGDVLGTMFAEIDRHPTRVRLPDEPLMLVDRILTIEGEPLSMTSGRVVTEHDIHPGAWYLDCGRIPTCIAVESGQADLFLSGWLGIDFETQGLASYRLLDAVVTFHDELPQAGKTIHYDIRVLHFFRQGDTYLFRFEFDATVDGRPLLTMREGCAGFFTQAELAGGKGIIHTALDKRPRPGKRPADWSDPVPMAVESYDDSQLLALRQGDLAACFGPAFAGLPLREPVTIPGLVKVASDEWRVASAREASLANVSSSLPLTTHHSPLTTSPRSRMWLIDRVLKLDPVGGKFGMGTILGELDIHPDDWFLTCHFCDDQVMPGTLMYECCMHTLRIFLLRMGWVGEAGQIAYEPIVEVRSRLKCRGQVLSSTKKVWYEVTLKEVGYGPAEGQGLRGKGQNEDYVGGGFSPSLSPQPSSLSSSSAYCLADALMYADGKPIVEITDMSVRLTGLSREKVARLWSSSVPLAPAWAPPLRWSGEGWGEGSSSLNDPKTESVSHASKKPLTLALSPQSRGEGTTVAAPREQEAQTSVLRTSSLPLNPRPSTLNPAYDLRPAIFDTDRITAFAIGKPSVAFGDKYRVFDAERKIARLPGPPFQFLDRVVSIENCEPWKLEAGGEIVAQYDIPVDAWYFAANRQPTMPFAVLLETALQPCGWLAGYLGSALTSETDLSFRNLGGKAIQYREVTPQSGTLTTKVKITKVSQSGGMIIQNFDYHLSCNGEPVYVGDTYFGFFSKESLAHQVGIRDAKVFVPSADESARASRFNAPDAAPFANSNYMMVDNAELLLDGGPHGLGYVRGTMQVDPSTWFFKAHFYEDPVVPGSLGLESFFQLLKFYAAARWRLGADAVFQTPSLRSGQWAVGSGQVKTLQLGATSPAKAQGPSPTPHEWVYRGQVVPRDALVTVTAVIREVDDATRQLTAEGFLSVDGRVIYQMKSFTLAVV